MKIVTTLIIVISVISCQQACLERPGNRIETEIEVAPFEKIIVGSGIQLSIQEAPTQKVVLSTGENKIDNVHISSRDGVLEMEADATCMLSGSYAPAKVYVSSPLITSIRNASEYQIVSEGILHFPELTLLVEDDESNSLNVGDFDIQIDNHKLYVVSNGIANCYVSGTTDQLILGYYNGIGRFEGEQLVAKEVHVFHRAENTLRVYPTEILRGDLYSIGNLVSYYHPPVVDVTAHYEGRLIFY